MNSLFPFFFLLFTLNIYAQSSEVDSLKNKLNNSSTASKIDILNDLAEKYSYIDLDTSFLYAKEALKLSEKSNNQIGIGKSYIKIGNVYFDRGNYSQALNYYLKALNEGERGNNDNLKASAFIGLGNTYYFLRNYDKALEFFKENLKINEGLNNKTGIATAQMNIAVVYLEYKNYDKALDYFNNSLFTYKQLNDLIGEGKVLNNMAYVYSEQGKYTVALKLFKKSLEITKELKDKNGIAIALTSIAETYFKLNNVSLGLNSYSEALKIATETGNKELISTIYQGLYKNYKLMGDNFKALEYLELYKNYSDSILNIESAKLITEMDSKYQSEKKEKEIALLTKDKEKQQLVRNSLAGGVIMVLILAGVVYNRYRIKHKANQRLEQAYSIIEEKNMIVEEKNKNITDSIHYAKRLQKAILPAEEFKNSFGDNGFVFYKPKDIVSGDFYWMEKKDDKVLLAAVDCTGHGVPGAFMSIMGHDLLNQIVKEKNITTPGEILDELNKGVSKMLKQKVDNEVVQDGMDLSLCSITYVPPFGEDAQMVRLEYAGAFNPLWIIRNGILKEIKPDKFPIGNFLSEFQKSYTNHELTLQQGDMIYLFSDGFADQFGGPAGKKFKYKPLKELLLSIHQKPCPEQNNILEQTLQAWKGNLEQVDDIMVIGMRV